MAIIKIIKSVMPYDMDAYHIPNLPRLDFNIGDTLVIKEIYNKPLKIIKKHHIIKLINSKTFDCENYKLINISHVGGFMYDFVLICEIA